MDKVFRVELSGDNRRYCELDLPATDYELLDALERLQLRPGDKPGWEFIEHTDFQFLHAHLTNECDLYQLNALATRLAQMDSRDKIAFEGLFNMEVDKKYGPISIATMIDLAYSTDCCHVVEGVTTDAQLGEFYAENDFMPELNELPDSIFQLLDFDKEFYIFRTVRPNSMSQKAGSEYEEAIITNYDPRRATWQLSLENLLGNDCDTRYELMHEPENPLKKTN